MMDLTIKTEGFAELAAALRDLPGNLGKNVLRSAVAAGAAEVRKEAKRNAEGMRDTGTLARAIYQKQIGEQSGPERQVFYVGARHGKQFQKVGKKGVSQDAYYARFVELGHYSRPSGGGHIKARAGARGREAELNRLSAAGSIHWVPAHPFLRPAFDVKKDAAITAMGNKIRDRLEQIKVGK
jgi:HK97 gp10 family phage protein